MWSCLLPEVFPSRYDMRLLKNSVNRALKVFHERRCLRPIKWLVCSVASYIHKNNYLFSKLVCISLVGSSKEWSVSLPDTEEALCVAAGSGVIACATTARLLRLFTPMGTQRQVYRTSTMLFIMIYTDHCICKMWVSRTIF